MRRLFTSVFLGSQLNGKCRVVLHIDYRAIPDVTFDVCCLGRVKDRSIEHSNTGQPLIEGAADVQPLQWMKTEGGVAFHDVLADTPPQKYEA